MFGGIFLFSFGRGEVQPTFASTPSSAGLGYTDIIRATPCPLGGMGASRHPVETKINLTPMWGDRDVPDSAVDGPAPGVRPFAIDRPRGDPAA